MRRISEWLKRASGWSGGRQNVDFAIRQHVFGAGSIGLHMGGCGMGAKGGHTGPFFNHDKGINPELGLHRASVFGVDRGLIGDAAILGQYGGDIGLKHLKDLGAQTGFGCDDSDDVDMGHGGLSEEVGSRRG